MTTESDLQSLRKKAATARQEYDRKVARIEALKESIVEGQIALHEAGCSSLAEAEAKIEALRGEAEKKTARIRELLS